MKSFPRPGLLCYPMHGQQKLSTEGYRTRDGHLIQWFGQLERANAPVWVVSRPEPYLLDPPWRARTIAANTVDVANRSFRIPNLRDRRRWWIDSLQNYPAIDLEHSSVPAVVWNPFMALAARKANPFNRQRVVVLDLLDDWTVHFAFRTIQTDVERAYRVAFDMADHVTANSEGTLALAHKFGRHDARLVLNGVDPERFSQRATPSGPLRIGYVGKIGKRLDLGAILASVQQNRNVEFVFAGPILDSEYRAPLASQPNLTLLGDVHYDDVPALLQTFDLGWVPHRVGEGEVGGDVIKTYEYRAAGLPTLASPVAGISERNFTNVTIADGQDHANWISQLSRETSRLARVEENLPVSMTWQYKAKLMKDLYDS